MSVVLKILFCIFVFIFVINAVNGLPCYDLRSNYRKIAVIFMELADLKADLKEEREKTTYLENELTSLKAIVKEENTVKIEDINLTAQTSNVEKDRATVTENRSLEQIIYDAFNEKKKLREAFENKMKIDFKAEKERTDLKFHSLETRISSLIDTKLNTLENNIENETNSFKAMVMSATEYVQDIIKVINNSIASVEHTRSNLRQHEEVIANLIEKSEHQNTSLMKHDAILTSLDDVFGDLQASIWSLHNSSSRFKVCLHGANHSADGLCQCPMSHYGISCEKEYESQECEIPENETQEYDILEVETPEYEIPEVETPEYEVPEVETTEYEIPEEFLDCYDIQHYINKTTGVYDIKPHGMNETITVMCVMDTDGGWTVFQNRFDGSENFYRNFTDYENGFGNLAAEFWLGLRYIQAMTASAPTILRLDLSAADGDTVFQVFDDFYISEGPEYTLHLGASNGTAVDTYGLSWNKNMAFSTYDHDVGTFREQNCAMRSHGGWWYKRCSDANLNGEYATPGTKSQITDGRGGMTYYDFKYLESLKSSRLMFRRK